MGLTEGYTRNDVYQAVHNYLESNIKAMKEAVKDGVDVFGYVSWGPGKSLSEEEPERFYHGFVLGMMVELADRYVLTSNRESGFGRYDVMPEPKRRQDNAIIIEFKVQDGEEKELSDTVKDALRQIEERNYQAVPIAKGIPEKYIRKYGFAFCGKRALIGGMP